MIIYPPLIADTIPAFTADAVKIPFENNPAVFLSSIKGFKLIVKDYNSSSIIAYSIANYTTNIIDEVTFIDFYSNKELTEDFTFTSGNYYKFQMAYYDNDEDTTFYYSSASIGRCVEKENSIYITGSDIQLSETSLNPDRYGIYRGVYSSSMLSEPLYSYRFIMKNNDGNVFQDSDIQIFDNSKVYNGNYSTEFKIKKELKKDTIYTLQFFVTTINGYQSQSPAYKMTKDVRQAKTTNIKLSINELNTENGYIELKLSGTPNSAANVQIERTSDGETWDVMAKYSAIGNKEVNYTWKDFSIEQGIEYQYVLVQKTVNATGEILYYSERTNPLLATLDFENIFLTDGEKQLKIKYDPKISSFKDTILESSTTTIGGQYPFFFRNGQVRYKEIPISGLISYWMDRDNFFMSDEELGISEKSTAREQTNTTEAFGDIPTTNLVEYNYTAERKFKLAVLKWLTNGKPKLFRSPSEGNYVVQLMSVSMSPRDTLGRIVHDFSCTGYECAPADIESLQANGLVQQPEIKEPEDGNWETYSNTYGNITWTNDQVTALDLVSAPSGKSIVIKNIKWQLVQPQSELVINSQDYLYINDITDPFFNPTRSFTTSKEYLMTGFTLHKDKDKENANSSIEFEYKIVDANTENNYIDTFATSVSNGIDIVMSIPINVTIAEAFGKVKPLAIYTLVAQRDKNAKDSDNFDLTLEGQTINLSDGQIKIYNDIPFEIEKGNGVHIDMYLRIARTDLQKYSSQLGKFILGYSELGGAI